MVTLHVRRHAKMSPLGSNVTLSQTFWRVALQASHHLYNGQYLTLFKLSGMWLSACINSKLQSTYWHINPHLCVLAQSYDLLSTRVHSVPAPICRWLIKSHASCPEFPICHHMGRHTCTCCEYIYEGHINHICTVGACINYAGVC